MDSFESLFQAKTLGEAMDCFSRSRLLSPFRLGLFGTDNLNRMICLLAEKRGWLIRKGVFYKGMPIVITRNDPAIKLYNGDAALIYPEPDSNRPELYAWIDSGNQERRRVALSRLPDFELAYAMTVHRSQGSEYDSIDLCCSSDDHPLLTRELIYTAVSRARKSARIFMGENLVRRAINRPVLRYTGMVEKLNPPVAAPTGFNHSRAKL